MGTVLGVVLLGRCNNNFKRVDKPSMSIQYPNVLLVLTSFNRLIGDVIPSNPVEMIFCICLMILYLTLLRLSTSSLLNFAQTIYNGK
jgi:hypothetical protein